MTDWNNKEEVLEAVREDGMKLENASEELRADKEVVLAAVKDWGAALEHASKKLQGDKDVENIFMGLCLYDLKRRDIIKEFSMTEGQYDNGLRRLKTILKNTAQQFNLKSKAS